MKEPMKNPGIEMARQMTLVRLSVLDAALRMDQERREAARASAIRSQDTRVLVRKT